MFDALLLSVLCFVVVLPSFVSCVQLFLQSDSVCPQGVTQQVTHRVAPLLVGGAYGDNVRLLNSVIQVDPTGLIFNVHRAAMLDPNTSWVGGNEFHFQFPRDL